MMKLTWQDVAQIAETLYDTHPDVDPQYIRFTDLHRWIGELDEFDDDLERSNEKILESIQMLWIEEAKD